MGKNDTAEELELAPLPFEIVIRPSPEIIADPTAIYLVRIRPETRGDCLAGGVNEERPCPWVSCDNHMAHAFPDLMNDPEFSVSWLDHTCVLDIIDGAYTGPRDGDEGLTAASISRVLYTDRKEIDQLLRRGIEKMRAEMPEAYVDDIEDGEQRECWDYKREDSEADE